MKYIDTILITAKAFAEHSYCKRRKVGAVLIEENGHVIDNGYNGTISGQPNECEGEDGRTLDTVLHAEQNVISYCARKGKATEGGTMVITLSPCVTCSKLMAQAGIKTVIYDELYKDTLGIDFLKKVGVEVFSIAEIKQILNKQ